MTNFPITSSIKDYSRPMGEPPDLRPPTPEQGRDQSVKFIKAEANEFLKTKNGKKILNLATQLDNIAKEINDKQEFLKRLQNDGLQDTINQRQIDKLKAEISSLKQKQNQLAFELKDKFNKWYEKEAPPRVFVIWRTKCWVDAIKK